MVVLGISRPDGTYIGAPRFDTEIRASDTLVLYGRSPRLCELDRRPDGEAGDEMHAAAVEEHRGLLAEEELTARPT